MRKTINIHEAKSPLAKQADLADKLLKELNAKASNKIRLVKADIEIGDADESKLRGALDSFNTALESAINALAKI